MGGKEEQPFRLIIERHGGMGDCLFVVPLLRYFRAHPPAQAEGRPVEITFSTQPRNQFIFKSCNWGPNGERCVDRKIDLFPLSWRLYHRTIDDPAFIAQCREHQKKLPFIADAIISFFEVIERNHDSDLKNAYDYHFEWVGVDPLPLSDEAKRPPYTVLPQERAAAERILSACPGSFRVGIQMHSSSLPRTWDKNDRLIKELCRRYPDAAIYSFGDPHAQILELYPHERPRNYMPLAGRQKGDSRLWAAMIATMDLLITVDTGALHLAGAVGLPVIGIFSTVPGWTRLKYYRDAVAIDSRYECAPCFRIGMQCAKSVPTPGEDWSPNLDIRGKNSAYPCLASITVEEVMAAAEKMIPAHCGMVGKPVEMRELGHHSILMNKIKGKKRKGKVSG